MIAVPCALAALLLAGSSEAIEHRVTWEKPSRPQGNEVREGHPALVSTTFWADPDMAYNETWFEQPLDHFSFVNSSATFKQRVLINQAYFDPKRGAGPIFLYTGNEGDIEAFAANSGFMWDIAPDFGALLVFAEHRYYGKSNPFGAEAYKPNPALNGYLTSEQALADFANLAVYLKDEYGSAGQDTPLIAFGGSYGGMLSAWFRIKYPHICDGAIAASAPIAQFTAPCDAFGRIVTADYEQYDPECPKVIRQSWDSITKIGAASKDGPEWLSETFKLCTPITNSTGVDILKEYLNELYTNLAMMNYPYPTDFIGHLPGFPVNAVCKRILIHPTLKNETDPDKVTVSKIAVGAQVFYNYTGATKCLRLDGDSTGLGADFWDLQSCNEMVMPMCYDGKNDMFEPSPWNFTQFAEGCMKRWGIRPEPRKCDIMYGSRKLSAASNIVFSNGMLDPWMSGGVTKDINKSVISLLIPEGAHHLDLRGSNARDPVSVIKARKIEKMMISSWIKAAVRRGGEIPRGPDEENLISG